MSNGTIVRNAMGSGTQIRCVALDGTKGDYVGKDFEDLFEYGADGHLRPKDPDAVKFDVVCRNKMTMRGLSWQTLCSLRGHASTSDTEKMPSEITYGHTRNPFQAFIVLADATGKPADARPEWDESNLERDANIPDGLQPNTPFEGKRGVGLNETTDGDFMRRISLRYVSVDPYRELEILVFARATQTHTKAAGDVTVTAYGSIADGDTLVLDDGINPALTFEFDTASGPGVISTAGRARIDISSAASNDDVRDAIIAAINSVGDMLYMSAAIGGAGKVDLTHTAGGTLANGSGTPGINITGITGGVTKTDMMGGTGAEGADASNGNKEIDNLPIKAFALAYGVECGGASENESSVGLRAILGLVPTIQGVCDRDYVHEICSFGGAGSGAIATMKDYSGLTDTITDDGYIEDSSLAEETVADCDAAPTITPASNQVSIPSAEWDLPETVGFRAGIHERLWLKFTGGTHDGEYHKIKRVVSTREVEVFSSLTANDATSVDIIRRFHGAEAFDGYVENEGLTTQKADSSDPVASVILGQKWASDDTAGHEFGRVFSSSKSIKGIRVIFPAGVNKDFVPHKFKIQTLDPTANGGSPRPGQTSDWIDLPASEHDYTTANFQGDDIYNAGQYGVEYVFTSPVTTQGVRLALIDSYEPMARCEIAELMVYEEPSTIALSDDFIRFSVDGGSSYKRRALPDVAATDDYQELADSINGVCSGYQVEAVRSEFGYLWFRGTVAGDNSDLDVSAENIADSSTCLVKLGLAPDTSTSPTRVGITESITKRVVDPMTFIIRWNISGDHPHNQ